MKYIQDTVVVVAMLATLHFPEEARTTKVRPPASCHPCAGKKKLTSTVVWNVTRKSTGKQTPKLLSIHGYRIRKEIKRINRLFLEEFRITQDFVDNLDIGVKTPMKWCKPQHSESRKIRDPVQAIVDAYETIVNWYSCFEEAMRFQAKLRDFEDGNLNQKLLSILCKIKTDFRVGESVCRRCPTQTVVSNTERINFATNVLQNGLKIFTKRCFDSLESVAKKVNGIKGPAMASRSRQKRVRNSNRCRRKRKDGKKCRRRNRKDGKKCRRRNRKDRKKCRRRNRGQKNKNTESTIS